MNAFVSLVLLLHTYAVFPPLSTTSQTCCMQADGSWGCCPFPDAQCCSDYSYCCPQGECKFVCVSVSTMHVYRRCCIRPQPTQTVVRSAHDNTNSRSPKAMKIHVDNSSLRVYAFILFDALNLHVNIPSTGVADLPMTVGPFCYQTVVGVMLCFPSVMGVGPYVSRRGDMCKMLCKALC